MVVKYFFNSNYDIFLRNIAKKEPDICLARV